MNHSLSEPLIAASILSADFAKLGAEIADIDKAGSDWIHVDVMDGHYVPNLTFGSPVIKSLRSYTDKPFDVHLMIEPVMPLLDSFIDAGADRITFHPNAEGVAPVQIIQHLQNRGVAVGLALSPKVSLNTIESFINEIDLLLVMTVEPGFGGQGFMHDMLDKIKGAHELIKNAKREVYLQVDGGVNDETSHLVCGAGANVLVAGSAVFEGGNKKYQDNINRLKKSKLL